MPVCKICLISIRKFIFFHNYPFLHKKLVFNYRVIISNENIANSRRCPNIRSKRKSNALRRVTRTP